MAKGPKRPGGTPPKAHQFKPGQSGNPGGRPKGSRNARAVAWDILERMMTVQLNGQRASVTTLQALLQAKTVALLKDPKDLIAFLTWLEGRAPPANDDDRDPPLDEDELALLEDLVRRRHTAEGGGDAV